jgi:hypothetical protein
MIHFNLAELQDFFTCATKALHTCTKIAIQDINKKRLNEINKEANEILECIEGKKRKKEELALNQLPIHAHKYDIKLLEQRLVDKHQVIDSANRHLNPRMEFIRFNAKETQFIRQGDFIIRQE